MAAFPRPFSDVTSMSFGCWRLAFKMRFPRQAMWEILDVGALREKIMGGRGAILGLHGEFLAQCTCGQQGFGEIFKVGRRGPLNPQPLNPKTLNLRWTPHPVMVTITDNKDFMRVLLYHYYRMGGPPNLNPSWEDGLWGASPGRHHYPQCPSNLGSI